MSEVFLDSSLEVNFIQFLRGQNYTIRELEEGDRPDELLALITDTLSSLAFDEGLELDLNENRHAVYTRPQLDDSEFEVFTLNEDGSLRDIYSALLELFGFFATASAKMQTDDLDIKKDLRSLMFQVQERNARNKLIGANKQKKQMTDAIVMRVAMVLFELYEVRRAFNEFTKEIGIPGAGPVATAKYIAQQGLGVIWRKGTAKAMAIAALSFLDTAFGLFQPNGLLDNLLKAFGVGKEARKAILIVFQVVLIVAAISTLVKGGIRGIIRNAVAAAQNLAKKAASKGVKGSIKAAVKKVIDFVVNAVKAVIKKLISIARAFVQGIRRAGSAAKKFLLRARAALKEARKSGKLAREAQQEAAAKASKDAAKKAYKEGLKSGLSSPAAQKAALKKGREAGKKAAKDKAQDQAKEKAAKKAKEKTQKKSQDQVEDEALSSAQKGATDLDDAIMAQDSLKQVVTSYVVSQAVDIVNKMADEIADLLGIEDSESKMAFRIMLTLAATSAAGGAMAKVGTKTTGQGSFDEVAEAAIEKAVMNATKNSGKAAGEAARKTLTAQKDAIKRQKDTLRNKAKADAKAKGGDAAAQQKAFDGAEDFTTVGELAQLQRTASYDTISAVQQVVQAVQGVRDASVKIGDANRDEAIQLNEAIISIFDELAQDAGSQSEELRKVIAKALGAINKAISARTQAFSQARQTAV